MPNLTLKSESSLSVKKDVLSIKMFIYKISEDNQKDAIMSVSKACNEFISFVKNSDVGKFAEIVKTPLSSGIKRKNVKTEKNGRTEYESVFEGYQAGLVVSVNVHFSDINENNLKLSSIYLYGKDLSSESKDTCIFIPNYEFIVSDELMKESKKKLRANLMADSRETATDIIGGDAEDLSIDSISYGVDTIDGNFRLGSSVRKEKCSSEGYSDEEDLDFESIECLISSENVEPTTISDSIVVCWKFKN